MKIDMMMSNLPPQIDLLLHAAQYLGVREIPGKRHNPLIVQWSRAILHWVRDDEVPWCSSFMNAVADEAGYIGTGSAAARSWLNVGYKVDDPQPGDIAVFWRVSPSSWQGHVGIVRNVDEKNVWILGGNQSNMVNVAPYPISRLLSYRRLHKK